jgi:SM-20-related protein
MILHPTVDLSDDVLANELANKLIDAVSWMPLYFLNRWEQFRSHELDMHWYYPIAFSDNAYGDDVEKQLVALDEQLQPIAECWEAIKRSHNGVAVRLYECMLSANAFGTEGRTHHDVADIESRPLHRTAIVFCNREWKIEWAGETLVFDEANEVIAAVVPKPGRVLKISGDPIHVGRSVSKTCPSDRRVLVFKYWVVP